VLATMHAKERAVAPAFMDELGLTVVPSAGLDTDQLGTFAGEIPRRGTMLEVAVAKARLGMAATGLPLGLASEGSFGPHPVVPFLAGGIELLVFVDDTRGLVLHETMVVERTNFAHLVTAPGQPLDSFLAQIGFPAHGLIVRANVGEPQAGLVKGIVERSRLEEAIAAAAASPDGNARLETDMRAHLNPTRMDSLVPLASRLAQRLASVCPGCIAPGWGRVDVTRGLHCRWCGTPTEMVATEIFGCAACGHREERPRQDGLTEAEPGNCPACNP